jgi:O-antigen biosynthesis protein
MKIDVIVPQYGQVGLTKKLIASLAYFYGPRNQDVDLRVILVDNNRNTIDYGDATLALYQSEVRWVGIQNSENVGFVRAINQGLCVSDAPFVVFQNNDTEVQHGLYEILVKVLMDDKTMGAVGPVCSDTAHAWQGWRRLTEKGIMKKWPGIDTMNECVRATLLGTREPETYVGSKMVSFFCTMFPAEVIRRVGLLSTDFGIGLGDDDDYCARIRRTGYKIGLSLNAYCTHVGRATFTSEFSEDAIKSMSKEAIRKLSTKYGSDFGAP